MNRAIGFILVIVGAMLLIQGINASQSFISSVSKFFTGSPTDKAMWMVIGGVVVAGIGMTLVSRRSLE